MSILDCIPNFTAALYGVLTMGLAFLLGHLGSIFEVTLTVLGVIGGPVGGCFFMGLFLPFVNKVGALVGMVVGLSTSAFLAYQAYFLRNLITLLPTSLDACPEGTDFSLAKNTTAPYSSTIEM